MKSPSSMRNADFTLPSVETRLKKLERKLSKVFSQTSLFLLPTFFRLFGLMWSTHAGWLRHLPALPILLLKFVFPHNFLSVGPKNYEICTHAKLILRHMFIKKKFQKI
jgi:hypothetical protein